MKAKPSATRPVSLLNLELVSRFWRHERRRLVGLAAITVVGVAFSIVFPRLLGVVVDKIQNGLKDPESFRVSNLLGYAGVLLGLGVARSLIANWRFFLTFRSCEVFMWQTRNGVFQRILDKGLSFTNRFPTGDVMVRLDADLEQLSWFAGFTLLQVGDAILTLLAALGILLSMNPLLTLITVLPVSLTVFVWLRLGPLVFKWYKEWREQISATSNALEASYSGIRLVKSYTMEERSGRNFRRVLDVRIKAAIKAVRADAIVGLYFTSIAELGVLLVLVAGGSQVIHAHLTIGEFVAFNAYVLLLINPMFFIGHFFVVGKQAQAAEERIRGLRDFPPDVDITTGTRLLPDRAEVRLEHVDFAYTPADTSSTEPDKKPPPITALQNISLVLPPGARIGIAGTVGSGKTTIMRLLLRIAEPAAGEIRIGGVPLKEFEVVSLRERFGYAPQEASLISDTVYNNITLGREVAGANPAATEEQVWQVARIAQIEPELRKLPGGLQETIGERGLKLSGGQQGRVSIARALFGKPRILLLDDVTASLDAETEQQFIRDVVDYMGDATLVIVSHRLSILAACDKVYVFDQGKLVESGTHAELLQVHGTYWKLYERQLVREALEGKGA